MHILNACLAHFLSLILLGQRRRAESEDLKMVAAINKTMHREFSLPELPGPTTLNLPHRRRELQAITRSNLELFTRIERVKSDYAVGKLESDFKQTLKYSLNSSFFLRKKCEDLVREVKQHKLRMSIQ